MDIFTRFIELGAKPLKVKGFTFYILNRGSVVSVLLPNEDICENYFPSSYYSKPSKFVGNAIASFIAFA